MTRFRIVLAERDLATSCPPPISASVPYINGSRFSDNALFFVLAILALLLSGSLWQQRYGQGGWLELEDLQARVELERRRNLVIAERNRLLREEVAGLRAGSDAIESRARYDLGMIRRGEVFFRIDE